MLFFLPQRFFEAINRRRDDALAISFVYFIVLATIVGIMYFSLPKQGDIWWPDASRNALNGAFVLDFLRAAPFGHPIEFAYDYYRQYPGLTILFYPPLFYVVMAGFYAVWEFPKHRRWPPSLLFCCCWLGEPFASPAIGWNRSRRWPWLCC